MVIETIDEMNTVYIFSIFRKNYSAAMDYFFKTFTEFVHHSEKDLSLNRMLFLEFVVAESAEDTEKIKVKENQ